MRPFEFFLSLVLVFACDSAPKVSQYSSSNVELEGDPNNNVVHPEGSLLYPDGRIEYPDEAEVVTDPDGTRTSTNKETEISADGTKIETETIIVEVPDGSKTETVIETVTDPDGTITKTVTVTKTDANGNVTVTVTETVTFPDGTVLVADIDLDGTRTITSITDPSGNPVDPSDFVDPRDTDLGGPGNPGVPSNPGVPDNPSDPGNTPDPSEEMDGDHTKFNPKFPRYNEVRQKSAHKAHKLNESIRDMIIYYRVHSFELYLNNDLSVYEWGEKIDPKKPKIGDYLRELAMFNLNLPEHEVITIFIDLRDGFNDFERLSFYNQLVSNLRDRIFTPKHLMDYAKDKCPDKIINTLQDAVSECAWPPLNKMRGKFIFAVTGGTICNDDDVSSYSSDPLENMVFLSPDLTSGCPIDRDENENVVFFNVEEKLSKLASPKAEKFITRFWDTDGVNNPEVFISAIDKAHHISTAKINDLKDSWTITYNKDTKWPFSCFEGCEEPNLDRISARQVVELTATSGDIWGKSDEFVFAKLSQQEADSEEQILEAFVSAPVSHGHEWAKGCLMARKSTSPSSPYLAVCRPNKNSIQVQIRETEEAETRAIILESKSITNSHTAGTGALKIMIDKRKKSGSDVWCAFGYGESNAMNIEHLGLLCFDSAPILGLAASSHDKTSSITFMFANPKYTYIDNNRKFIYLKDSDLELVGASDGLSSFED